MTVAGCSTSRKVTSEHQAIVSKLGSRGPFGHQLLEPSSDIVAWCSKVTFLIVLPVLFHVTFWIT
jgi:hypothetical protein